MLAFATFPTDFISLQFTRQGQNASEIPETISYRRHNHNSDGSTTVEFRVDGLGEIIWWILGYGDQVQVLAPKILRGKILEVAKNMIKLNKQI